jgi:hypothetical protein
MRAAAPVEVLPGRRVTLPQRIIGLAVQPADGPPLFEDFAQPIARRLPLVRIHGQILGFRRQRLLAGGLSGAELVALGPLRLGGFVGVLDDRGQACGERVDVTEHVRLRQGFGECGGGRLDLARIARP